jgi:ATP/maltotriose-dependent transcriptional regulator MalT/DNA-binding SARP family transcriptional activator
MTILLTKVRPPQRRKDVLRRVRLVDILHQNIHRKLTFVSAPAGYGKTTLLVDFAADLDAIVCWYRIGLEDSDLIQFVSHIVAALQQQIPNFGKTLEQRLNSPGAAADAPSLATELINEIQLQVQDFCVLVLDDYHLAGENQQIVDFLENFLENLPDQLRILIGSRSVYGIPTASLYIRDELVTISADELRFRAEELQKLVLQNYRIRLSQEQAEELAKRADGWIVALLLAVRTMENGGLPKLKGGIEKIYEYLAEEVVNRQSEELRGFMLATSILSDFNEAQCNYLLERNDSGLYLRALEERNLFVSRTETKEGNSYRFHQLFSEFLQGYFIRHQPEHKRDLHRRAAEWHKARKEWESAIQHKLAASDKEDAAAWMDAVAEQFYMSDRQMLLARWLDQLSKAPDCREFAPRLLLFQAKSLVNLSHFDPSLKLLDLTEPLLLKQKDSETLANATITRGMIYRFTGKYEEAIKMAQKAEKILRGRKAKPSRSSLQWLQAERLKAVPAHYLGNTEKAIESLKIAVQGFRKKAVANTAGLRNVYLYDLAECLNDLGFIYITSGQMLDAQKAFQETLDIHVGIRSNLGALASARNNIAYLHHQIGHYGEAWKAYGLALENARAANRPREQIAILSGRGALLLDLDEIEEARISFGEAIQLGNQAGEKRELIPIYMSMARLERFSVNHNEAMAWLRKAATTKGGFDKNDYAVEMGSIYADMGQNELALKQFDIVMIGWSKGKAPHQNQVLAAFLEADIYFQKKEQKKAEKLLVQAFKGSAQLGYDEFLVVAARRRRDLLNKAASAFPSPQITNLIRRVEEFRPGKTALEIAAPIAELPPLNLEIQALGTEEIRRNSEIISGATWRSSRARALFFYILDKARVRKETIGLDFWPDFSPGKISSNFHATLWRVRQAIGFKDAVLFEGEMYFINPSIKIWYDVAEFENYLRQALALRTSDAARDELLRQAVNLYRGPYLQDIYMEWVDQRREQLRNSYLDALTELAALEAHNKRYREAKDLFEKIVQIDPYRDEAHLALMKCLVDLGSASAAIVHFKRYKSLLRQELNAEPQAELQKYYDQLAVKV